MDVYKWAVKLGPLVPGELLLDAFELARDIRYLDMQASPYDMREWGGEPVRIETPEGKAEYVRRQRAFAERVERVAATHPRGVARGSHAPLRSRLRRLSTGPVSVILRHGIRRARHPGVE